MHLFHNYVRGTLIFSYLRETLYHDGSSYSFQQGFEEADKLREILLAQLLQEVSDRAGLGCNDASVSQSVTAVMSSACNDIRQRLLSLMGFSGSNSASLIMCPSGSDAEFFPLVVALIRSNSRGGKNNTSVLQLLPCLLIACAYDNPSPINLKNPIIYLSIYLSIS